MSRIDQHTLTGAPVPAGRRRRVWRSGSGSVWVANSGDATVTRIDPNTAAADDHPGPARADRHRGRVRIGLGDERPGRLGHRDRPGHQRAGEVVPVGAWPTGIAAGAGYLWVTNQGDGTVTRFHPETHMPDPPLTVGRRTDRDRRHRRRRLGHQQPGRVTVPDRRRDPDRHRPQTGRRRRRLRGRRPRRRRVGQQPARRQSDAGHRVDVPARRHDPTARRATGPGVRREGPLVHQRRRRQRPAPRRRPHHGRERGLEQDDDAPRHRSPCLHRVTCSWRS